MRGRRKIVAVACAAATIAAASPADAGASGTIVRASAPAGAFWHTVSAWAPPGSPVIVDLRWTVAGRATTTAGFVFIRAAGLPDTGAGLLAASFPGGRHASATVTTGPGIRHVRIGSPASAPIDGGFLMRTEFVIPKEGGPLDLAIFVASDRRVRHQRIGVWFDRGAVVRAESRGSGSFIRRERDFADLAVVSAGEQTSAASVSALATVRSSAAGTTSAGFRRGPVMVFSGFGGYPSAVGAGSWQGGIPAVLTLEAPDRTTAAPDQIARAGPAGLYRYRIDAFAAAGFGVGDAATGGGVTAGKPPTVIVAAADTDFPACSTPRIRVRTRARDGHPVCGP